MEKTLHNTNVTEAKKNVKDIDVFGNGNMFQLLYKASSNRERWVNSTKAMEIPKVGCVVQVTTQQGDNVSESVCFVPGVEIVTNVRDNMVVGRRLVKIGTTTAIRRASGCVEIS